MTVQAFLEFLIDIAYAGNIEITIDHLGYAVKVIADIGDTLDEIIDFLTDCDYDNVCWDESSFDGSNDMMVYIDADAFYIQW